MNKILVRSVFLHFRKSLIESIKDVLFLETFRDRNVGFINSNKLVQLLELITPFLFLDDSGSGNLIRDHTVYFFRGKLFEVLYIGFDFLNRKMIFFPSDIKVFPIAPSVDQADGPFPASQITG